VEVSGNSGGQLVIVVPSGSSQEEVMDLGQRIADQAPANTTVNARIFNDRDTAINWRTAPADWTAQHLLAVVSGTPESGTVEVRWIRPDDTPPPDSLAIPPPEEGSASETGEGIPPPVNGP
jgi:hypothetical protein